MMDATHPWFLTGAGRGNPASALARDPAWTEGNAVSPLIHGQIYFSRLADVLGSLRPGDHVYLTDWRGDDDQHLNDSGPTLSGLLVQLARRGVEVRGLLWRSHPHAIGFNEEEETQLAEIVNGAGGQLLLDERVRRAGSHHQKLVIAHHPDRPDDDVAFIGGIDLCHGRRDDIHHQGDPQAQHLDRRYGQRAPWHDVQAQVRGPAVADLAETFRERWNDRTPLEHRSSPLGRIRARALHEPTVPDPLSSSSSSDARPGTHQVQVLRTYPSKRPRAPFAPDGERSIARFYIKAIARARSLLYIEDQYFWSREVGDVLAGALRSASNLRVIAVVPRFPDRDGAVTGPAHRIGQEGTLDVVRRMGGDRVAVYDLENETSTPIYVHAKVVVVDDEVALIGSDNMNRRSWTHDSELSIAVVDRELDDRAPQDPGGHGEGARKFARDLRLSLTREHLGVTSDDDLIDPVAAFEHWRATAAALDGWHASGEIGPRPPGRARAHEHQKVPTWQRMYAIPIYRMLVDPDGRSSGMRRRHTF